MKFSEAKIGMLVSVTGPYAIHFPEGAEVIDKVGIDSSIKIKNRDTGFFMWFFELDGKYSMEDIHPLVETKPFFRKLPPTTFKVATYLGLDAEKVTCYVDKENGTITVRHGNTEAKAKKSPKDTWDFRLGMGLALCRLKEKLAEHRKPAFMEPCHYILKDGVVHFTTRGLSKDFIQDSVMYAMGNVFNTQKEAEDNTEEMLKRTQMIIDFCKKQGW
ncbi:MAG: hypothetical protein ACI4N8_08845 [Megasphaera sp.]|uniref:hypothetical protein n=1 Tax=Megasphaera sp. TaxID=2023260 RepID=UPI003EFC1CDD